MVLPAQRRLTPGMARSEHTACRIDMHVLQSVHGRSHAAPWSSLQQRVLVSFWSIPPPRVGCRLARLTSAKIIRPPAHARAERCSRQSRQSGCSKPQRTCRQQRQLHRHPFKATQAVSPESGSHGNDDIVVCAAPMSSQNLGKQK